MQILRLPAVTEATGLSRSAIYKLVSQGEFPRQVKLTSRAVGWPARDIEAWLEQRVRRHNCDTPRPSTGASNAQ